MKSDIFTLGKGGGLIETVAVPLSDNFLLYAFFGCIILSVFFWLTLTYHWSKYGKGVLTMPAQIIFTGGLAFLIVSIARLIL